jgi:hypothetical protein
MVLCCLRLIVLVLRYCIIFIRIMYVLFTFYCIGLYYCIGLFYLFIFFCTRVGLLPPGAHPIAVKNNNNNDNNNEDNVMCRLLGW